MLGYEIVAQPSNAPMQLCTAAEAYGHDPTAAECQAFAQSRAGEIDGVTAQISGGLSSGTTGACVYNSGGSNAWQILSSGTLGPICEGGSGLCACVPTDEYVTIAGQSISGSSPIRLNFDTYNYPGSEYHGQAMTAALCCQLCSQTAAPSAPPSPPQVPTSPSVPPLPPGVPPPPPNPLFPPGTQVAAASAASEPGFSIHGNCEGIVITDDGYCHLFNDNTPHTHNDEASGCTTTGCDSVQGRNLYIIPNSPPPPYQPSHETCRPFTDHRDEIIPAAYVLNSTNTEVVDDADSKRHATQTPLPAITITLYSQLSSACSQRDARNSLSAFWTVPSLRYLARSGQRASGTSVPRRACMSRCRLAVYVLAVLVFWMCFFQSLLDMLLRFCSRAVLIVASRCLLRSSRSFGVALRHDSAARLLSDSLAVMRFDSSARYSG